jgi:WhiB family redox-sensing transcriptional regulator
MDNERPTAAWPWPRVDGRRIILRTHVRIRVLWAGVDEHMIRWLMTPGDEDPPSLEALLRRPEWHRRAACRGVGSGGFVVVQGGQYDDQARRLCGGCPVRQECLETALADPDLTGMWGGTTPVERRQMRRGRAVA